MNAEALRDKLEANWGWDPKRGSIPFKRPRITPKNIRTQRKVARPGTLIHSASVPQCIRTKKKVDVVSAGNVTYIATAGFIENVNCLACRKTYFARGRA